MDIRINKTSPREYCNEGDYVCPAYNELGQKSEDGEVIGSETRISKMAARLANHAAKHGELLPIQTAPAGFQAPKRVVPTKPAKGARAVRTKNPPPRPEAPQPVMGDLMAPTLRVDANYSGGLKKKGETLTFNIVQPEKPVESVGLPGPKIGVVFHNQFGKIKLTVTAILDHELAYCLVFEKEDDMIFIPEEREQLQLTTPSNQVVTVFFPGVVWIDGDKRLMPLFKVPDEN